MSSASERVSENGYSRKRCKAFADWPFAVVSGVIIVGHLLETPLHLLPVGRNEDLESAASKVSQHGVRNASHLRHISDVVHAHDVDAVEYAGGDGGGGAPDALVGWSGLALPR